MSSPWPKATVLWFCIAGLAILNGALRESLLLPTVGRVRAYVASGILLSLLILAVAWLSVPWFGALPAPRWWQLGVYWLALTLVFEFGFGRFVRLRPWRELIAAYTFRDGNLWPLVLVVTVVAPWLAAHWRGAIS